MTAFDMLIKNIVKLSILFLFILILFQSRLFSEENLGIEIDKPKFSEKGLDNRLYEIKAEKGIQREGNLELFIVEGKLRTDSGIWIYLNARRGNFNQEDNLIELNGEINFYTDEEDRFQSDKALFSINDDLVAVEVPLSKEDAITLRLKLITLITVSYTHLTLPTKRIV